MKYYCENNHLLFDTDPTKQHCRECASAPSPEELAREIAECAEEYFHEADTEYWFDDDKFADKVAALLRSRMERAERPTIKLEVFQQDWMPGFAAFHDDGIINETAKAHLVLNIGSFMAAIKEGDLNPKDLPYFIAESLMHEVIHVFEAWAKVEFSEDRVEELLTKYREKYQRATVWEYTGAEPLPSAPDTEKKA